MVASDTERDRDGSFDLSHPFHSSIRDHPNRRKANGLQSRTAISPAASGHMGLHGCPPGKEVVAQGDGPSSHTELSGT